ncbi:MAG: protein phosphatase 2C domain-containing protein [Propionibacteriaceae bacterium]|jgi:protein phosphatase|nr:protein phosphatase 2C domain-containing protein [Propionibacteriaceae bacterium]
MSFTINYLAHSEIGLVRKNNQDSVYASPGMLLVADGMGGAAAGDLASAVVIRTFREIDGSTVGAEMLDKLGEAVEEANAQIEALVLDDPELDGMGSTVCGALFDGERLGVLNVGDSRGYLFRGGQLTRITHDHSWVQTLVDEGRLTEEESLIHPHRSLILRVINGETQHNPDLSLVELELGDRLLFCSDGLSGLVVDDAIAELIAGDLEEVRDQLIDLAHEHGGSDNITFVIADVQEHDPQAPPQERVILGAAALIDLDEPLADITSKIPAIVAAQEASLTLTDEEQRYAPTAKRRPRVVMKVLLSILIPVLLVAGGGAAWLGYTQQQYFVGANGDTIAIFKGVNDPVLHLPLSQAVEPDSTLISDLPPYYQRKVRDTIAVKSVIDGRATLTELKQKARYCIMKRQESATPPRPATPGMTPGPSVSSSQSAGSSPVSSVSTPGSPNPADTSLPFPDDTGKPITPPSVNEPYDPESKEC